MKLRKLSVWTICVLIALAGVSYGLLFPLKSTPTQTKSVAVVPPQATKEQGEMPNVSVQSELLIHESFHSTDWMQYDHASQVDPLMKGVSSLTYAGSNGGYFDGGSGGELFRCPDGQIITFFIPNPAYWSESAKAARKQPIGILATRDEKEILIEIVQHSPLEKRIVELIASDLEHGDHNAATKLRIIEALTWIRDRMPVGRFLEKLDAGTNNKLYPDDS